VGAIGQFTMKTTRQLRVGDTVRVSSEGSVHRNKIGVVESFADSRHSARVRWADESTGTPHVSGLALVPASAFASAKERCAEKGPSAHEAGRSQVLAQLSADVHEMVVLMREMHALALENSGRATR